MCSTPVRMPVCPLRTCVLICAEPSMHVQHAVLYALACQPVCHKLYQVLHKGLVFWCAGSNWLAGLALSVAVNLHTRTIARPHIWKVSYSCQRLLPHKQWRRLVIHALAQAPGIVQ